MAGLCREQAELCASLGSELYRLLLDRCVADIDSGGPVWTVLRELAYCPADSYPALRLLGSVHRLVLDGRAPALAVHYPSVGGSPQPGVWEAFRGIVAENAAELTDLVVGSPPQTNEVGRAAALLGGFLEIAAETGLPLRLLEVGASAGLNLGFDRYRYESGTWSWGDTDAPLRLTAVFEGPAVPRARPVEVVERLGCDVSPVDPHTDDGLLTLLSYVWPDQPHRIERLRSAIRVVRDAEPRIRVAQADAMTWLREQLTAAPRGVVTVVFHSIVLSYFDDAERRAFEELIAAAGERATATAPLAWLSLERAEGRFEVRLRRWPGAGERLLARCGGHGLPVVWHVA